MGVRATHGDELFSIQAVRLFFTRQGFVRLDHLNGYEPFARQRFKTNRWRLQSNAQLFRWLSTYTNVTVGFATFYDSNAPYQGRSSDVSSGFTFQPSGRPSESVAFERVAFDRASTGERVYMVHILNTRTAYQFTNHFFLRGSADERDVPNIRINPALSRVAPSRAVKSLECSSMMAGTDVAPWLAAGALNESARVAQITHRGAPCSSLHAYGYDGSAHESDRCYTTGSSCSRVTHT